LPARLPLVDAARIDAPAYPNRERAVARPAKKTSAAPAQSGADLKRPPQPQRYKASKDELLKLYREMLLIRRFEERAGQLYGLGLIGGFCHLYIGQEAVAVGLQSALTGGKDSVITGYRDHGHMLAYGIDPKLIMAKLWNLPVIYAIENNKYAMGTSIERSHSEPLLYRKGESFRIPGFQVDGMDVLAVRGAAQVALDWVRGGKGPIIVEFNTYRYRGHSMSDPARYRTREEVQDVREHNDPIDHAAKELEKLGVKEEELKAIDKEIKDIVVG